MRFNFQLLLLLCLTADIAHAQNDQSPSLDIGDPAPPLRVREWLKGTPVQKFEKGQVYVLEFWATWCQPCVAAIPHLSNLARKYRDKVTIIGIDVYEGKSKSRKSMDQVKAFVDSMGSQMDFNVAIEDSNFTVADWIEAAEEKNSGIPRTFVLDAEGRLAWIGYPQHLDEVLSKIVNNTWDVREALTKRTLKKQVEVLDDSLNFELNFYFGNPNKPGDLGKPDSILLLIDEMVRKVPQLKYAPFIVNHAFSALVKTDPQKAYKYGKEILVNPNFEDFPYHLLTGTIEWASKNLNLPSEIYELGAEAYQVEIDQLPYPEIADIPKYYKKMADMYFLAKNKPKAIEAMQKAIEALKNKKDFSKADMATYKSRLQQYKIM